MTSPVLPSISLLDESNLRADSPHSVLISLLRGAAAVEVAAAHLRAEFFPSLRAMDDPPAWYQALAFLTGFAHQAVVVFFLISGWLVGGSLWNKYGKPQALTLYAIDRLTRLWSVLVPTFLLMAAIAIVSGQIDPRAIDLSPDNPYSLTVLLANLLGLQTISVPQFGGNYPLWSLANETWYYVLAPLLLVLLHGRHWTARVGTGLLIAGIAALLPLAITLYFCIWLLGAAFSRVRIDCGRGLQASIACSLLVLAMFFRLTGDNDDQTTASFPQDLLISLPVLLLLSALMGKADFKHGAARRLHAAATGLSSFSFTLYVVHVPLLGLMRHAGKYWYGAEQVGATHWSDLAIYAAMLLFVLVFAYGFYLLFEARTAAVRRAVKAMLLEKQGVVETLT